MSREWEQLGIHIRVPSGVPLVVLLRHAERPALPPHEPGNDVALTPAGRDSARRLGTHLGDRLLALHSSPIRRCLETAEALREGAGAGCTVVQDRMLGDPGVIISDPERAWTTWMEWGHDSIFEALMVGEAVATRLRRAPGGHSEARRAPARAPAAGTGRARLREP